MVAHSSVDGDTPRVATFARGHYARSVHAHNRRELKLGSSATTQPTAKARWYVDPADAIMLRGLPAISPRGGVGGAIRGTRPGDGLH
jgi:hypothetical protein